MHVLLLVFKPCQRCLSGHLTYHLFPAVNAESCFRAKQATGAFTSAGHYTDLMPFNSARHAANQSQLPACRSPYKSSFWLSALFRHPECRQMTAPFSSRVSAVVLFHPHFKQNNYF